jgi:hypothetical protein
VALANKLARIVWAVWRREGEFESRALARRLTDEGKRMARTSCRELR